MKTKIIFMRLHQGIKTAQYFGDYLDLDRDLLYFYRFLIDPFRRFGDSRKLMGLSLSFSLPR